VVRSSAVAPPGYLMVLRYLVTCCIADARPVGLIVKDTTHGSIHDNQWVTVTGTMGMARYQGDEIAVVIPQQIKPTKSQSPYIY
jgi:putative membrane protein